MDIFIFTLTNKMKKINKTEDRKLLKVPIQVCQDRFARKGIIEEVTKIFQGNYLQACYQSGSSTPTDKGPTAQRETKQARRQRKATNSMGNQKTSCDISNNCNKTVTRNSNSLNQLDR